MRVRHLTTSSAIAAVVLLTACYPTSGPIGPNQHFQALVNGSNHDPVVHTVCPGPVTAGRMGTAAAGQTLSVVRVSSGGGNTGVFSEIRAWVDPATPTPPGGPPSLTFATYGTDQTIPSTMPVPCSGPGRLVFSSCPYLAPCAAGFVQYIVDVQFQNIAA